MPRWALHKGQLRNEPSVISKGESVAGAVGMFLNKEALYE